MGVTKIVPPINTINEIAFREPFLALINNPIDTGNKNRSKNTSNLKLNANVENPIKNSDGLISITLP